jgi:thioredoxin-dependent peroxiredoxin
MVEEGAQAPDFELPSDDGGTVRLSDLRGKPVVLYFYPKDDTPGCTLQARNLRDVYGELQEQGAVVLGVSRDDAASHRAFREKYGLPFSLLSDLDGSVVQQYDVWREKTNYGKTYLGIHRSTFVIDADGTVKKALYGTKPDTDAERVLQALSC